MFSVPDIAVIGVLALLLFGPDKLPGILRQAGKFMREVQNTSHSFVAEMERAADMNAEPKPAPLTLEPLIPAPPEADAVAYEPEPGSEFPAAPKPLDGG